MPDFSMFGFNESPEMNLTNLAQKQAVTQGVQLDNQKKVDQIATQARITERIRTEMQNAAAGAGRAPGEIPPMNGSGDLGNSLSYMANIYADEGDFKTAGDLLEKSALITSHKVATINSQMDIAKKQGAVQQQRLELAEQIFRGSTDQASWDKNNTLYYMMTGTPSPYAGTTYDPNVVADLTQKVLSAKDKIAADINAKDEESKAADRQSRMDFRNFRKDLMNREQDLREGHEARLSKSGGKAVGSPTKDEVDHAYALVDKGMEDLDSSEKLVKAYAVAGKAKALRLAHPGLDVDTSMQQAMRLVSKTPGINFQDGKTPINALPLPTDRRLEVGKFYVTPKGVGKFNGTGIELMPTGSEVGGSDLPEDAGD